jgi:DNA topoisomerase IB
VKNEVGPKFKENYKNVNADADKGTGKVKEAASCLRLIMSTGIRPTDENDNPKPIKDAYGAVSMLGKHVFVEKGRVRVELPAKKGTTYKRDIDDTKIAMDLIKRKRQAGDDGKIFNTTQGQALAYSKNKTGFILKDYRTLVANNAADREMAKIKKPTTEKEYNISKNKVLDVVSGLLCNGRGMAYESYIDKNKWKVWRKGIVFAPPKKKKKKEIEDVLILTS